MARRRKTEGKTVAKFGEKTVAVRKSSRQIAKKHETGKTYNGELNHSSKLNDSEESGGSQDDQNQREDKINDEAVVHKKFGKYRCLINDITGTNASVIIERCKRDTEESDSQDGMESSSISSVKFSPEAVRQMVVGGLALPNESPAISNSIQSELPTRSTTSEGIKEIVWQKDVIEETIICEGMEVEEDAINDSYTINQDGSIVVEEVLLVTNQEFGTDGVVELSVLESSDVTKSMVVTQNLDNSSPADKANQEEKLYQNRQKAVSKLSMNEYNGKKPLTTNPDLQQMELIENEIRPHNSILEIRKMIKEKIKPKISELPVNDRYANFTKNRSKISIPQMGFDQSVNFDTAIKSSEKLGCEMQIPASCTESSEFVSKDLNWVTLNSYSPMANRNPLMKKREDVMTQRNLIAAIHSNDNEDRPFFESIDRLQAKIGGGQESGRCIVKEKKHNLTNFTDVSGITMKTVESSMVNPELCENGVDVEYSMDALGLNNESQITNERRVDESSADSETDLKAVTEDVKICSSSENSNDMLPSTRSYKLPEFTDTKSISNQPNELEKKIGFRSRSGSTDTTGSESGSNSSGVRRSSRIRTIGLMKQRCRGRGLVTKPNFDLSKTIFQHDREKLSFAQEHKDNSDNQSETQSDRENSNNKTPSVDLMVPASLILGTPGYESDTSKPVKVKSRWRRSSELEMGGNVSHKLLNTLEADAVGDGSSSRIGSPCNEGSLQSICKVLGSKTPSFSGPQDDKEMKERLSQFEHLKENLYLTERYTNKETKRMVCDCFLTKEEINRGELGCGEDCLNRLLMIECGARCVVGERCTNKRFQQCDYAKCEVFRTEKKGFGLRAMADLPAGEFLMEYVGEVVDPKDFRRRAKDYSKDKNRHYYFMALKSDQIIDATMKGNVSRFINHSCDPNSETQKWTVNGELRIGFFNKQFIAAGEEITFDYHFQRYGKEAQKCFCEAENCRGWIGETPEEEKEKSDKKEKQEKDTLKKKKEEKKVHDYIEDEDLEEEIEKLCLGGLKNRAHTLTLSRLMVRSREIEHRTLLLCLIQNGEQPCRRLFLDYHGLRLIWSYMMDVAENDTNKACQFRLEILKTLRKLPIPNKTMLMDSKVFSVIEKWATKQLNSSPSSGSPDDEHTRIKVKIEDHVKSFDADTNDSLMVTKGESAMPSTEFKQEMDNETRNAEELTIFTELAKSLLCSWSNLKEVFRIPKKERIEQMKEHEREADRGYKEDLEKEDQRDKSYDRSYRSDRYGRSEGEKRLDRRRGRESPEFEYNRSKDKRVEERTNLVPIPRMSKFERRQLFAMQVAKEEKERQRRQQQGTWQEHEVRCLALGMDPHTSAALDPQTGYSLFFNPALNQWQTYSAITDSGELTPQCPVYLSGTQAITNHAQSGLISSKTHMMPTSVFTQPQLRPFNHVNSTYSAILGPHHDQFANGQFGVTGGNLVPIQNGSTQLVRDRSPIVYTKKLTEQSFENNTTLEESVPRLPLPQHLVLPLEWRYAKDERGRTYYYNVIDRVSQWLPPPPDHIPGQVETSSSSESSEESSSSDEDSEVADEDEIDDDQGLDNSNSTISINETVENSYVPLKTVLTEKPDVSEDIYVSQVESKKRRDGLVQERIISPRREEERVDHKKYKEIKYKLRRQKEKAKLKEQVNKLKKHRKSGKSKSHAKQISISKIQTNTADISSSLERRIKDTFRINMANVMVHFLNPYRKNECKQGRITNTEDFKHLARKLTHFVLAKELKHCKSVDELQCNENVKHKAKDFVRKYMSKFGAVYQKTSDED